MNLACQPITSDDDIIADVVDDDDFIVWMKPYV